jgi:RNA polymerase sigma factor (sigma-70 family)
MTPDVSSVWPFEGPALVAARKLNRWCQTFGVSVDSGEVMNVCWLGARLAKADYDPTRGTPEACAYTYANSAGMAYIRNDLKCAGMTMDVDLSANASSEPSLEGSLQRLELNKALSTLSPWQRQAVVWRYCMGFEQVEVAAARGVSPRAVRKTESAAKRKLWVSLTA